MEKIFQKIHDFSNWVAIKSVDWMSTMLCVFLFLVLSVTPLFWSASQNIIAYISSDIIQLVALPLIMVGQKLSSIKSAKRHGEVTVRQTKTDAMIADLSILLKDQDDQDAQLAILIKNQEILMAHILAMSKE